MVAAPWPPFQRALTRCFLWCIRQSRMICRIDRQSVKQ